MACLAFRSPLQRDSEGVSVRGVEQDPVRKLCEGRFLKGYSTKKNHNRLKHSLLALARSVQMIYPHRDASGLGTDRQTPISRQDPEHLPSAPKRSLAITTCARRQPGELKQSPEYMAVLKVFTGNTYLLSASQQCKVQTLVEGNSTGVRWSTLHGTLSTI